MKTLFALLLLFTSAYADYQPERLRPIAIAVMDVRLATGSFAGTKEALLTEYYEDGKGIVAYELSIDGKKMKFDVVKYKQTKCGDHVTAKFAGHDSVSLTLADMSEALCDILVVKLWTAKIEAIDAGEPERVTTSSLHIEGNPEFLTQTR